MSFFKKLVKEVSRPFQYAAKTGQTQVYETGRSSSGGQISRVYTNNKINDTRAVQTNSFIPHLRSLGLSDASIDAFQPLIWVTVGSREKKQFCHRLNSTTVQKTAVAVRRTSQNQLLVSVISYESRVDVVPPKTIIQKSKKFYGPGYRKDSSFNEEIDRGLSQAQLASVMNALEAESSKYNPTAIALNNV